jgi:hypothetical protein
MLPACARAGGAPAAGAVGPDGWLVGVVMGGIGMNQFGALMVAELCEAIADFVDASPDRAAACARKLGTALRHRLEVGDTCNGRELDIRAANAKHGRGDF